MAHKKGPFSIFGQIFQKTKKCSKKFDQKMKRALFYGRPNRYYGFVSGEGFSLKIGELVKKRSSLT